MANRRASSVTDAELYELRRQGYSYKQIADRYFLSQDSIRGRVSRYHKKLRTPESPLARDKRLIREEIKQYLEIGIDDVDISWVKDHVLAAPKQKKAFHIRGSAPTAERIMTKIVGSKIEYGQYVWYDDIDELWYYGVDDDDLT